MLGPAMTVFETERLVSYKMCIHCNQVRTFHLISLYHYYYLGLNFNHSCAGNFFVTYPRHRKLISVNKRHTGQLNKGFSFRHDWNSLISEDESLLMKHYSKVRSGFSFCYIESVVIETLLQGRNMQAFCLLLYSECCY